MRPGQYNYAFMRNQKNSVLLLPIVETQIAANFALEFEVELVLIITRIKMIHRSFNHIDFQ